MADWIGLGVAITKLSETVSAGIGHAALPWQTKRLARADAEAMQIVS